MKQITIFFIAFLYLFLMTNLVVADISLGVSPGVIRFEEVLKGGFAHRKLTISTSKVEPVITAIRYEGELASWIRFSEEITNFTIAKDAPFEVDVIIEPPLNAENGNYSMEMHVRTQKLADLAGSQFGTAIKADITVKITVEVTGNEIRSCYVGGLELRDSETGYPLDLYATISNDGNTILSPLFEVFIWDQLQEKILLTSQMEDQSIYPTMQERIYYSITNDLPPGQYFVSVRVPECGFSQKKTFDILSPGGISDKGELVAVNTEPWVYVGDIVPIIGVFKNTGERAVDCVLKIVISKNDKVFKTIETETLQVLKGETQEFKQFFTPIEPGRYEVSVVGHYNKKITFEKGAIINVKPEKTKKPNFYIWPIYIIMLIVIILLVRNIVKSRTGW